MRKASLVLLLLVLVCPGCGKDEPPPTEAATEPTNAPATAPDVQAIAEEVQKLGGQVETDVTVADGPIISVNFGDSSVTDAGLGHIKELKQLKYLYLWNTKVSDVGLDNLVGLDQLEILSLEGTKVTKLGVKKLQAALPKCQIFHD